MVEFTKVMWLACFLISAVLVLANAATCPTCPTNGIWSEWTASSTCPTTCGSCSTLTYTRTCLSTAMGCPCTGATSNTTFCGTQACNWPRMDASGVTCCVGSPTIYNNWYHCGAVGGDTTLACCPDGGYWATWSSWSKITDQIAWTRSRTCLSGGVGCPCTGDSVETKYTCPCAALSVITSTTACSSALSGMTPFTVRTPVNIGSECTSMFVLEASNFREQFYTADASGNFYTNVGVVDSSGTCTAVKFYTGNTGTAGQFYRFKFTCNVDTGYFEGTYQTTTMSNVVSIAQFY